MNAEDPGAPKADVPGVVTVLALLPFWWLRAISTGTDPQGLLAMKDGALAKPMILSLCAWGFLVILLVTPFTHSTGTANRSPTSDRDRAAYDGLRQRGMSERDAAKAAPSVRRLCEAAGGTDCR